MLLTLEHLLEPDPFAAGKHADPRSSRTHGGQTGRQETGTNEEVPQPAHRIEPEGDKGGRRQGPAGVRCRPHMEAHGLPARQGIIAHQLEVFFRRARDETETRPAGLDHRARGDVSQQDHVEDPATIGAQGPRPFGCRRQVQVLHVVSAEERMARPIASARQVLAMPAGLGQAHQARELQTLQWNGDGPAEARRQGQTSSDQRTESHGWRVVSSGSPGAARLRAGSNSRFRSPATGLKWTVSPSSPRGSNWRPLFSLA
jgi:hypothetical protein